MNVTSQILIGIFCEVDIMKTGTLSGMPVFQYR